MKKYNSIYMFFSTVICIIAGAGIIIEPVSGFEGAKLAVENCAHVLIPGIFPFMVITQLSLYTGAAEILTRPFGFLTEKVYKLPRVCGSAVVLSLIGGYPVGAKMIHTLYKQRKITQKQAARMALFCVGAGPAFVMGTVGTGILKSSQMGVIIFFSQLSASVIIGLCISLFSKDKPKKYGYIAYNKSFSDAFTTAVKDASSAVVNMCSYVIFFGSMISIGEFVIGKITFTHFIDKNIVFRWVSVVTEVTNACVNANKSLYPALYSAFAVGFGGLCVHFQIFSMLEGIKIKKWAFMLCRLIQGILSALFTYILCSFFPFEAEAAYIFGREAHLYSGSGVFSAITLIIMCAVYIVSQHEKRKSII